MLSQCDTSINALELRKIWPVSNSMKMLKCGNFFGLKLAFGAFQLWKEASKNKI